jgi:hypothetical protein
LFHVVNILFVEFVWPNSSKAQKNIYIIISKKYILFDTSRLQGVLKF